MKKFIALASASFAVIITAGCSNIQELSTYCGKSISDHQMCFKAENVSCKSNEDGDIRCRANGVRTDLAGEKSHYTGEETICYKGRGWSRESNSYVNKNKFSCSAAEHFGMIDDEKL